MHDNVVLNDVCVTVGQLFCIIGVRLAKLSTQLTFYMDLRLF